MRKLIGVFAVAGFGLLAAGLSGCEKAPPAASGSTASSGSTAAPRVEKLSDTDKAAMREAVGGNKETAPATTTGQTLPPGHPPISGMSPPAQTPPAAGNLPPGHPPISDGGGNAAPAGSGGMGNGAAEGELKFEPPTDWKPTPPASSMRKAQFALPHTESDTADGELAVFFFGAGQGGGVADNLDRWRTQFSNADGSELPADAAKLETLEANGMKVTVMEVEGTYTQGMAMGGGNAGPQKGYRMIAGVIEAPGGSWFVKATGPDATIAAQRDAIKKYMTSAKP